MLHTISWLQFAILVALGLVLYYSVILLRYYQKELRAFSQGKGASASKPSGSPGSVVALPDAKEGSQAAVRHGSDKTLLASDPPKGQVTLFDEKAATDTDKPELFKVMEQVISKLRTIVEDGVNSGITKEELEDHVRGVLASYKYLRQTPYEVAINNFIVRTCTTHFSLMLSEEELAQLW